MIVSNSSPLMYLAKIGKLSFLKVLFKEIIIPKEVYEEVVIGKNERYIDSFVVEKAVKEGWIKVKETKINNELEGFAPEIDKGEIAVISLAKQINSSLVLIDDASARTIAESFDLNVKGTLYVLLKAFKSKITDKKETIKLINRLISSGFRISQESYMQILNDLNNY